MEVVAGALHTVFPMDDSSRVGEARRHAAALAEQAGLDQSTAGRLAIVVTELGNNLARHATGGRLLLARSGATGVEVISMDEGPGMSDVERCMSDGYSTAGTPGTGLGAIKRMADDFEIHSAVPHGTIIISRLRSGRAAARHPHGVRVAGISIAAPGENVCGDSWAAGLNGERGSIIVADGLGHGPDAAEASLAATAAFSMEPAGGPKDLLTRAHEELRRTRGAAVSILHLDIAEATIRCCGAGNVLARVISGVSDRAVLTQHGTVGLQIRRPEEVLQPWPDHAVLIVHSDGIESRWGADRLMPVLGRDPQLVAAILIRDHCRGRDDATVVVMRREG